jgi:hypothetical protein
MPDRTSMLTARQVSRTELTRAYITASEIGDFTYCPESWYLRRFGHVPDPEAIEVLRDGTRQHERIGRTTERIVHTDALRRGLLILVLVLVLGLAALLLATIGGLLSPAAPPW